jgi:hypothetical protein
MKPWVILLIANKIKNVQIPLFAILLLTVLLFISQMVLYRKLYAVSSCNSEF